MASRVNTKFLLILVVCVVFVAGIAAGLFYLQYRGDAERHVRRGDELMQSGEHRDAMRAYGRAVSKQRSNPAYLEKFTDALMRVVPESRDDANELYLQRLGALEQAIRYRPTDATAHIALLRELRGVSRLSEDNAEHWARLSEAADRMWNDVPEDDPDRVEALFYRGIATYRQAFRETWAELEQAREDLETYVEARPESDAAHGALIRCYLALSARKRSDGSDEEADALLDEALNAVVRAQGQVVDGADVARSTVIAYAMKLDEDETAIEDDSYDAAVEAMIEHARDTDDPLLILEVAEVTSDYLRGRRGDAIALVKAHVDANPDDVFHQLTLARLQYQAGALDDAETNAKKLADDDRWLPVSYEATYLDEVRRQAASTLVDIEMRRWHDLDEELGAAAATGDADAQTRLAGAREAVATAVGELRSRTMDPETDPLFMRADGKLAVAEGDYARGAKRFSQLAAGTRAPDEVLQYAALCLEQIGEYGAAYEYLKQLVGRQPNNPNHLFAAGAVASKLRRFEEAAHWLEQLDDHTDGKRLLETVRAELASSGVDVAATDGDEGAAMLAEAKTAIDRGEIESARATLNTLLDENENNVAAMRMLVRAELAAGRPDQARRYVDRLIEMAPQSRDLLQLKFDLESADRIEAIERFVDATITGPVDRMVAKLVHLQALVNAERGRADYLEGIEDPAGAAAANDLADRAEAASRRYLAEAERTAPDHPQLQSYLFYQALADGNRVKAEEMVEAARRSNADLADGALFAGQLALQRERWDEAARLLQEATRKLPYSSNAWRSLALAHESDGNFGEAKKAYEQAYTNNGTDIDTIDRYVNLLVRTGDHAAALRVIRNGYRQMPENIELREKWLQLETIAGDAPVALKRRLAIYREDLEEDPADARKIDDAVNAIQLALFLSTAQPYRELVLGEDGREVYTEAEWNRLRPEEQTRIVTQTKRGWFEQANRIADRLEAESEAPRLSIATLRARINVEEAPWSGDQARAKVVEGLDVLERFIAAQPEEEITSAMLQSLASYQREIGRFDDALQTLERARRYQDPVEREADVAIGTLHFSRGNYPEAMEAYSRAVQVNPNSDVQLRLIECRAIMGQYDQAQAMLEARIESGNAGYAEQMLSAAIAGGEAESLYRRAIEIRQRRDGDPQEAARLEREANRERDRQRSAWNRASRLNPSSPNPYIQRAVANHSWFQLQRADPALDGQSVDPASNTLLRDALAALNEADAIRTGDIHTRMTRVAILQTMGNDAAAIGELERVLDERPHEVPARKRLVQLHNERNDVAQAEAVLEEGIRRNPALTVWYELKGDLSLNRILSMQSDSRTAPDEMQRIDQLARKAAAAYRSAVDIETNAPLVGKLVGALLNQEPPAYREAADILDENRHLLEAGGGDSSSQDAALLRSLYARALLGTNERDAAVEQLGEAYRLLQGRGSSPSQAALNQWYKGVSMVFAGRPVSEIEQFVAEQAPPTASDYNWLAGLHAAERTPQSIQRAIELQRKALDSYDGSSDAAMAGLYYNLAIYLILDEQYQAAIEPFGKALEHDPNHRLALNNYAFLLADELRQYEEALPLAERAAQLTTDAYPPAQRADVLDTLGWIQFLNGNRTQAESTLRQSMQLCKEAGLDDGTASNNYHLAAVLADMGRFDAARNYLDQASHLNPDPRTKAEIDVLEDDIRTRRK